MGGEYTNFNCDRRSQNSVWVAWHRRDNSVKMNVKGRVYDYVQRIWIISERVNFVNWFPVNGRNCAW